MSIASYRCHMNLVLTRCLAHVAGVELSAALRRLWFADEYYCAEIYVLRHVSLLLRRLSFSLTQILFSSSKHDSRGFWERDSRYTLKNRGRVPLRLGFGFGFGFGFGLDCTRKRNAVCSHAVKGVCVFLASFHEILRNLGWATTDVYERVASRVKRSQWSVFENTAEGIYARAPFAYPTNFNGSFIFLLTTTTADTNARRA